MAKRALFFITTVAASNCFRKGGSECESIEVTDEESEQIASFNSSRMQYKLSILNLSMSMKMCNAMVK